MWYLITLKSLTRLGSWWEVIKCLTVKEITFCVTYTIHKWKNKSDVSLYGRRALFSSTGVWHPLPGS